MKLAIDAREAFSLQKAGKGQWTHGFLQELLTRQLDLAVLSDNPQTGCAVLPSGMAFHKAAAQFVVENEIDLFISPTSYITPTFLPAEVRCIPIVHDMIAFRGEQHAFKPTILEHLFLPRVVKKAAHICTVSEATKRDLIERYPKLDPAHVTSIYAGPMSSTVSLSEPDNKTILCVGTLCPRKNQQQLVTAYASLPDHLRQQYRLVLVGARGWHDDSIVRYAQNTKGVEWKDYVTDDEYQALLSRATVFAYPSLYEGFGMQVLDAMQRGIPVLTSNRGSLAEVAGDSALVVDPEDENSIATGLIALLEQADLRERLREMGPKKAAEYSWKQTVDIFLDVVKTCV